MLIAHAPAGLLIAALLMPLKPATVSWQRWYVTGAVFGVLPDLDMLWFYLVDHRQFHHHVYLPHWPIVWLSLGVVSTVWWQQTRSKASVYALLLAAIGVVHVLMDGVVGDIGWFKPWGDTLYSLFEVTNRYSPWQLNFIIHWSFALELLIVALAIWQWRRKCYEVNKEVNRF